MEVLVRIVDDVYEIKNVEDYYLVNVFINFVQAVIID